ncbi:MAG: methylated-DNA--[protein]-cysteine S-methyltransferase [Thermoleophilia bacterium]|nr:methylated-DNA--[protein]-cysteine S-methyltransferase [Thermoleophilia bacterium]
MECERAGFWTAWGEGSVAVAGGMLVEVTLPSLPARGAPEVLAGAKPIPAELSGAASGDPTRGPTSRGPTTASEWARELEAYFAWERLTWSVDEVDLDHLGLTPFREAVYRALLAVRPGAVVTYGELAAAAGRPRAARAVGSAMAENPLPVVVPCHRVVRSDGSLGRYGDDERWKPLLLTLEGAL